LFFYHYYPMFLILNVVVYILCCTVVSITTPFFSSSLLFVPWTRVEEVCSFCFVKWKYPLNEKMPLEKKWEQEKMPREMLLFIFFLTIYFYPFLFNTYFWIYIYIYIYIYLYIYIYVILFYILYFFIFKTILFARTKLGVGSCPSFLRSY